MEGMACSLEGGEFWERSVAIRRVESVCQRLLTQREVDAVKRDAMLGCFFGGQEYSTCIETKYLSTT